MWRSPSGQGEAALGMADYALALDVGTSSVRASLFDAQGHCLDGSAHQTANRLMQTPDGGAEADPEDLWRGVVGCIDGVLAAWRRVPRATDRIVAVGIACFWHSLLGLNARGDPTTSVLTWADQRATSSAQALAQVLDGKAVWRRTGCRIHSSYVPAKLFWIRQHREDWWYRSRHWVSFAELLTLRLNGELVASLSSASASGLFDQERRSWDGEIASAVGVHEDQLPAVTDLASLPLRLSREWAVRWPELQGARWLLPAGDGACNNLGAGAVGPGDLALMIGTSGAVRLLHRASNFPLPEGLWRYRLDQAREVVGGALSNGGNLHRWILETLRVAPRELEDRLLRETPAAHGLCFLPLLAGERSMGWSDGAYGAVLGLRATTTAYDIGQAALEAVAIQFAEIVEALAPLLVPPLRIVGTGGAIVHSPGWTRILADAIGHPLVRSAVPEATSRGAALLALEAEGVIPDGSSVPAETLDQTLPDAERHGRYEKARQQTRVLYDLLQMGTERRFTPSA